MADGMLQVADEFASLRLQQRCRMLQHFHGRANAVQQLQSHREPPPSKGLDDTHCKHCPTAVLQKPSHLEPCAHLPPLRGRRPRQAVRIVAGQLQEALQARRRMVGPLALQPMRQHQHQPALLPPPLLACVVLIGKVKAADIYTAGAEINSCACLSLTVSARARGVSQGTCCQELVDLDLAAICKVAKLRLPHRQNSTLERCHHIWQLNKTGVRQTKYTMHSLNAKGPCFRLTLKTVQIPPLLTLGTNYY